MRSVSPGRHTRQFQRINAIGIFRPGIKTQSAQLAKSKLRADGWMLFVYGPRYSCTPGGA